MTIQSFKARVAEHSYLAPKYQNVHLELVKPSRLEFEAGQYVMMKIPGEERPRQYSIVSPPSMKHGVELLVDVIPGGIGSMYLASLSPGDEVEFMASAGAFIVSGETDKEQELWFVATGSGIAPVRSMLIDLLVNKKDKRPTWLHWGLRREADVFWFDEFARLAERYQNFTFDLTLSKPSEKWKLCKGYTTECVLKHHEDFNRIGVYLCGNERMIMEMKGKLDERGVSSERIHTEQFYG
jgi:ferredoxin-NADP reductase